MIAEGAEGLLHDQIEEELPLLEEELLMYNCVVNVSVLMHHTGFDS